MTRGEPLLGSSFGDAIASPFFSWFHFEPAEVPRRFRPSGAAFHALVALDVETTGEPRLGAGAPRPEGAEQVAGVTLRVLRRFIDDPRNGVFARDVTKSFLRAALSPEMLTAIPAMSDTVAAIEDLSQSVPVIVRTRSPWHAPDTTVSTPGYDVYLGRQAMWEATTGSATGAETGLTAPVAVRMANEIATGPTFDPLLVVQLTRTRGASSVWSGSE